MRHLSIIYLLAVILPVPIFAGSNVEWLKMDYDFGTIREVDGPKGGSFQFVNINDNPVIIKDVRATCGCTSVEWPKGEVAPGDTAVIHFMFDPSGRPGKIYKAIKVYLSGVDGPVRLNVKGVVKASESTLQHRYPHETGDLRFENMKFMADRFVKGMRRLFGTGVYNQGDVPLSPVITSDSKALNITMTPQTLNPGEGGTISLYLDTANSENYGVQDIKAKIKWGDADSEQTELTIGVDIVPSGSN